MKRPLLTASVAVAVIVCSVLYTVRVEQVNAAYPEQHAITYALDEPATFAGENSSGGKVAHGDFLVAAKEVHLVDYDGLKALVPDYSDFLFESHSASDLRALLVNMTAKNATGQNRQLHLRDFKAQSGAWSNGLFADLYLELNGGMPTIVDMEPGQELRVTLAFLMYDTQFNDASAWAKVDGRPFSLVLASYPDKYVIDLGVPGGQRQLQEAGR